jgi:hypothetical protein
MPHVAEREVSPIFVARDARSVEKLDETVPESEVRFPERVAIFPVAVVRLVSWRVFVPWIFWSAERTVSDDVTVPTDGVNPVRRDERTRAVVK